MMFRNAVVFISLFGMFGCGTASVTTGSSAVTECVQYSDDLPKYHQDTACNRATHNRFRENFNRYASQRRLGVEGPHKLSTTKTLRCPATVQDIEVDGENQVSGFDIVWIVENSASKPVTIGYVKNGVEYSAVNSEITPPSADPHAILKPGEWKTIFAFEGHAFNVREMLEDGTMGQVLLQHRPGLIPITNKYGPQDLYCNPNDPDIEPIKDDVVDPEFARTPPKGNERHCNVMDIGFRNDVGCPLHAYYTGLSTPNEITGEPTCTEDFKFHLGLHPNPDPSNWCWDWTSNTKYEGVYMGHNFVFRLASDPSVLIDKVNIQPTFIYDCPDLKQKDMVKTSMFVTPIGALVDLLVNASNATGSSGPSLSYNHTSNSYAQYFLAGSL